MTRQEYMTLIKQVFPDAENVEVKTLFPTYTQIGIYNIVSFTSADMDKLKVSSFAYSSTIKYLALSTKSITE